jgi:hypothetical protein
VVLLELLVQIEQIRGSIHALLKILRLPEICEVEEHVQILMLLWISYCRRGAPEHFRYVVAQAKQLRNYR